MITQSGPICDVCGKHILPVDPDERVNMFTIAQSPDELHCDNACKAALESCGGDWQELPGGPLRKAFEKAASEARKGVA